MMHWRTDRQADPRPPPKTAPRTPRLRNFPMLKGQQPQLLVWRQKNNLLPGRFLPLMYIDSSRGQIYLGPRIFFSSTALKSPHEPCELEHKRLLTFVDDPDFGPEDCGYLDRGKLGYKPEMVEQPLLLAQPAERPEE
jgi:hypothetical protein